MARIVAVTLLLLGLFAASLPAALAADKVALVVGNNQYAHAPRLLNPSRDARAIAGTLRSIGFDVLEHYDVDKKAMDAAMEEFARKARDARIGLVYYAGHGIQVHGNAYLVPVDVALEDDRDLRRLVPADYLMQDASKASSLGVVILDACRDNPFLKRIAEASGATRSMVVGRGLARISDVPKNTLIAYATQTGNVALDGDGENSPYAAALIKHLPAPGKDVRLIFGAVRDEVISVTGHQQEPYTYGSLGGEAIVINESPAGAGEAVVVPPAAGKTAGIPGQGAGPRDSTALTSAYAAWRTAIDGNDWKRLDSLAGKGSLFALLAGELAGASRSEPVGRAIASLAGRPLDLASLGDEWPYQIQTRLCNLNYYGEAPSRTFSPKSREAFSAFLKQEIGAAAPTYGALVKLAELSELRPAQSPLTGMWKGEYGYEKRRNLPPVTFEMDLTFSQGRISGFITEPNTFGKPGSANLYASFEGSVVGDEVQWTKTYDGTAGVSHSVEYAGKLDRKARRIAGNWAVGKSSGPFRIELK